MLYIEYVSGTRQLQTTLQGLWMSGWVFFVVLDSPHLLTKIVTDFILLTPYFVKKNTSVFIQTKITIE